MVKKKMPAKKEPVGSEVDNMESKRAEDSLWLSEEQLRSIVNNSRDIIYTMNIDREFIFVSPSVKDALGYSPAELKGRAFQSLVHPDDISASEEAISKNIEKGELTHGFECRVRDINGNWRWYTTSGSVVRDASGSFMYFLGIVKDTDDRRRLEQALRDSEEKFRSIVEKSIDVIYTGDTKGILTFISPEAMRLWL